MTHARCMRYLVAESGTTDLQTVRLPPPPPKPQRGPIPLIAAFVPVVGAVVMFLVLRSPYMLIFAALGPCMLVAGLVDRRRSTRRGAKHYAGEFAEALMTAREQIGVLQAAERERRGAAHPSLAEICAQPSEVWLAHPGRVDTLKVGTGTVRHALEIAPGDERAEVVALRSAAAELTDAPIVIPVDGGVCVRGAAVTARAVARAMLLQLCAVHPPGHFRVEIADAAEPWVPLLPHTRASAAPRTVTLMAGSAMPTADIPIVWSEASAAVPPSCRTVIDLHDGLSGTLRRGNVLCDVELEAVSEAQATSLAEALARRAEASERKEEAVRLSECGRDRTGTLGAVIGRANGAEARVDIVDDGPHAVVVGTTGAGKSEFLITWAASLCRTYDPAEVTLMLADFKGGTAFAAFEGLAHVVGVLTDLDGSLARRAVQSLAAEVRRREEAIAAAGARDISDPRVQMPRLVVVIDEFPALLAQHPDLDAVFVDIAARGRALGIHLIVGAQRSAGSIRDALLANIPLRIALRTADANDSRAVIGTDDAFAISGGAQGRGVGYVRRSGDVAPIRTRFALATSHDLQRADVRPADQVRPWLPPLPQQLTAAALRYAETEDGAEAADTIALGLADDPDHQRQPVVRLRVGERGMFVLGGPQSGKSNVIDHLATQLPAARVIPKDPEAAWDALAEIITDPPEVVLCDDLDVMLATWPEPWQGEAAARWEGFVRRAGYTGTTIVATGQRLLGPTARIAELLPRRALLRLASRTDHIASGGQNADFQPNAPTGRAVLDGLQTQFVLTQPRAAMASAPPPAAWAPPAHLVCGLVMRTGGDRFQRVRSHLGREVLDLADLEAGTDVQALVGVVLVGEPEQWHRAWNVTEFVRRAGELAIASELLSDARTLSAERGVLPYARAGRAWVFRSGLAPRRAALE